MTLLPITPTQFELLKQLDKTQGKTAQQIAQQNNKKRTTACRQLNELVDKGLAEKKQIPTEKTTIKKYTQTPKTDKLKTLIQQTRQLTQKHV